MQALLNIKQFVQSLPFVSCFLLALFSLKVTFLLFDTLSL